MKDTIIVDIDGTIADCRHRRHFVTDRPDNKEKDWDSFYDAMDKDIPIEPVIKIADALSREYIIVLLTARPDTHREMTIQWLQKHLRFGFEFLIMREEFYQGKDGQRGTAAEFKEEVLKTLKRIGLNIIAAIDDNQECVDMWRRNGIICLQNSMKEMPTKLEGMYESDFV